MKRKQGADQLCALFLYIHVQKDLFSHDVAYGIFITHQNSTFNIHVAQQKILNLPIIKIIKN